MMVHEAVTDEAWGSSLKFNILISLFMVPRVCVIPSKTALSQGF